MKKLLGTLPVPLLDKIDEGRPLVQNLGPGKVYLDTVATVSVGTGFEMAVGGTFEYAEDSNITPTVYAVADEANTDLRMIIF